MFPTPQPTSSKTLSPVETSAATSCVSSSLSSSDFAFGFATVSDPDAAEEVPSSDPNSRLVQCRSLKNLS